MELAYKTCRKSCDRPPSHPDITPPDISEPERWGRSGFHSKSFAQQRESLRSSDRSLLGVSGLLCLSESKRHSLEQLIQTCGTEQCSPTAGRDIRASSEPQLIPLIPPAPSSRAFLLYLCYSAAGAGSPTVFMPLKIITIFQNPSRLAPWPGSSASPFLQPVVGWVWFGLLHFRADQDLVGGFFLFRQHQDCLKCPVQQPCHEGVIPALHFLSLGRSPLPIQTA